MEVADGCERVCADDAVGRQAHVALELADTRLGRGSEDAVEVAAEEAQGAKRLLKLQHIVPMEVGHAQVQRPVAQVVRCVDERLPGGVVDIVAIGQVCILAERAHGRSGFFAEHAVDARFLEQVDD